MKERRDSIALHDAEHIDAFLKGIEPWAHAYSSSGLSYLAARQENDWIIIHARIFLSFSPRVLSRKSFRSNRVAAGYVEVSSGLETIQDVIRKLATGAHIELDCGPARLQVDNAGAISAHYVPLHPDGLAGYKRLPVLTLRGASRHGKYAVPDIDWELRSAPEPYESLAELGYAFALGGYSGDATAVEVAAQPVVEVAHDSMVSGSIAEPSLLLGGGLKPEMCRLGYRVRLGPDTVMRGSVSGSDLAWRDHGAWKRGTAKLEIPSAAVVQCFASYAGVAQYSYWIGDPKTFQNQSRALLELFDPHLEVTRDFLFESRRTRKNARDFEVGVAYLATLLGFSVTYIGSSGRLTEAPDLVATTPSGDTLVVECTTGLLKAENKLAKLTERAVAMRRALDASGHGTARLLAVLVTALERKAVEAELGAARQAGVFVLAREDLEAALARTIVATDARQVFQEAWMEMHQQM